VPVLYLHPIGLDGDMWGDAALPGALTPSFPGFGDTPLPAPPSFDGLVDFVADLLRDRGPADLVGVSLGSMVAQHVALRRPDRVRSVVLACGGPASHPQAMTDRAVAARAQGMAGILPSTLERWFTPAALAAPEHPGVAYASRRLLADDQEVYAQYWEAMAHHDVAAELGALRIRVTVVAGSADASVPVPVMKDIAARVPGAVFELVDGPHMLPLENASEFADVVARHLHGIDG
jgi:3-oxoadipate enol-lactonase